MTAKSQSEIEIERLTGQIDAAQVGSAELASLYYQRGLAYWRLDKKAQAMTDYGRAVEINPQSPAAEALQMAREIMDFYHKDLYNP